MNFKKLNSHAKINLSLNVIQRLPNKYHKIESLITFIQFSDEIKIKLTNNLKHKIYFFGNFSKGIDQNNTVARLFNLLEKKNLIKSKKFEIRIKKNIPQKSGMGGGSMNAACILKYLMKKKFINISSKNISEVAGLAIYSKKNILGGVFSIENLVKPCKAPFDPVPSTVPVETLPSKDPLMNVPAPPTCLSIPIGIAALGLVAIPELLMNVLIAAVPS